MLEGIVKGLVEAIDSWQLQPTERRRRVADAIMRMLEQECVGPGGAADATAAMTIALAEAIVANSIPVNWDVLADRAGQRIRNEVDRLCREEEASAT